MQISDLDKHVNIYEGNQVNTPALFSKIIHSNNFNTN